jgi:hypothetical protein
MKKLVTVITILLSFVSFVYGKPISFGNAQISFEAPDEFEPLSDQEIKIKYPASKPPKYVIGNKSAGTTIAYDIRPNNLPPEKIDELKAAMVEAFPTRIPGLKWKQNKIIEMSGRKWGYLEMTSTAEDTDIYNIMLFTLYNGQMVIFNFNSTKDQFKKYEKVLRESIKTIRIN